MMRAMWFSPAPLGTCTAISTGAESVGASRKTTTPLLSASLLTWMRHLLDAAASARLDDRASSSVKAKSDGRLGPERWSDRMTNLLGQRWHGVTQPECRHAGRHAGVGAAVTGVAARTGRRRDQSCERFVGVFAATARSAMRHRYRLA